VTLKSFNSAGIPGSMVAMAPLLGVIAVPNVLESQLRAKVARAKSDLRTLNVALESYFVDHNRYPNEGDLGTLTTPIAYITAIPNDPYTPGQPYKYRKIGDNEWVIFSVGPDLQNQNADIIYDPTNGSVSIGDIIRKNR
jgi:type II secretory pathway pseudopilin PulG